MNKAKLPQVRDRLAKAATALADGHKKLSKLENAQAAVVSELDQLQAKVEHHPDDEAAVARLLLLREQREHYDARIASFLTEAERAEDDKRRVELENALSEAVTAIVEAGRPRLEKLTAEVTSNFAPFFLPGQSLELAVARCDAIRSLKAFLLNGGNGYDRVTIVSRVLDSLLDTGTLPWSWPPGSAAKASHVEPVAHV
jgi:hypothetical protein